MLVRHQIIPMRWITAILVLNPAASVLQGQVKKSSDYLYAWTASSDTTQPDFLAVFDVRPTPGRYGRLLTTVPVPGRNNRPHHTEHQMPVDGRLFANGFSSGQTFIFDASDPANPRLDGQFGNVAGMMHPHSFLRLPNGNVLATFQMQHDSLGVAPGGIAELTDRGAVVRHATANGISIDRRIRPYSAVIIPKLDRVVTTTTDMDGEDVIPSLQVWRLSDLKLLQTFDLPEGPRGDEAGLTAEPRLLADGKTVLVSTFDCGLYLLTGLDGRSPSGQLVSSFPRKKDTYCAVPVVVGHYYLVTVPSWHAVVSLDISDPAKPREVSRAVLEEQDVPHWIAVEPNHRRVVITGYGNMMHRIVLANFDETTGRLEIDARCRDDGATQPGLRMDNKSWPHGGSYIGTPHGAVFSLPAAAVRRVR
jgi:hypothetical protein